MKEHTMTPRTLLTAISATAVAFAVAIGVAVGSVSIPATPVTASVASVQTTMSVQPGVARFTLLANQDCPFTV
jgi:hypothetical protein